MEATPSRILIAEDDAAVITKAFDVDEVVARIRARIREHDGGSNNAEHGPL